MPHIHLVWNSPDNQEKSYTFTVPDDNPNQKVKVGRDQQKCPLWLQHSTVSRVHAIISYKPQWQRFYIENIARQNPVRVDGGLLIQGEASLYKGSVLQFGQLLLQIGEIDPDAIAALQPATSSAAAPAASNSIVAPAPVPVAAAVASAPAGQPASQPISPTGEHNHNHSVAPKLVCPKCGTHQVLSLRNSNCPVCGHFLADASSRYFFPEENA